MEVAQLIRSSATTTLEDLAAKTKELYLLTLDFGVDFCVLFGVKERSEWQVTDFDDSWGFLCGPCGLKLSEKLTKNE